MHCGLNFGNDVYIGRDCTFDCPTGGELNIGDNVTLTRGVFISAIGSVSIGSDTMIGEYVSLRDANHGIALDGGPMTRQPMTPAPIRIANDVWVGRGAAVLSGVSIGKGAVVAANSVVSRPVDEDAIVGGIPARVLRSRRAPV